MLQSEFPMQGTKKDKITTASVGWPHAN
jgi:hypothetical protein